MTASYSYLQKIGSAWGVDQTAFSAVPPTLGANLRDGLRMAYGSSSGAVVLNTAWAAHGIFSSDIGSAGLQTMGSPWRLKLGLISEGMPLRR